MQLCHTRYRHNFVCRCLQGVTKMAFPDLACVYIFETDYSTFQGYTSIDRSRTPSCRRDAMPYRGNGLRGWSCVRESDAKTASSQVHKSFRYIWSRVLTMCTVKGTITRGCFLRAMLGSESRRVVELPLPLKPHRKLFCMSSFTNTKKRIQLPLQRERFRTRCIAGYSHVYITHML